MMGNIPHIRCGCGVVLFNNPGYNGKKLQMRLEYMEIETELSIIQGAVDDINDIEALYNDLNEYLACHKNYAGWRKGIYPIRETAESGVASQTLYIAKINSTIIGTVILNHEPELNYDKVPWPSDVSLDEVFVIHTLAVHPEYKNKGIGKRFLEFSYDLARKEKMKALRLDVNEGNLPAIKLYEDFGFTYVDTIDIGLGEHGLYDFRVYEKMIQDVEVI